MLPHCLKEIQLIEDEMKKDLFDSVLEYNKNLFEVKQPIDKYLLNLVRKEHISQSKRIVLNNVLSIFDEILYFITIII